MRPCSDQTAGGLLKSEGSEGIGALFEAYGARVFAYALRRASKDVAEDVVAETFIVALRRWPEIPEDPIAWLLAVARRVLANQRRATDRRTALHERLSASPMFVSDPAEDVEARIALESALEHLSDWDREALLLVAWDGLDNRAAAAVMNCSPPNFAVKLHRARRRLAQRLEAIEADARRRRSPSSAPMQEETR